MLTQLVADSVNVHKHNNSIQFPHLLFLLPSTLCFCLFTAQPSMHKQLLPRLQGYVEISNRHLPVHIIFSPGSTKIGCTWLHSHDVSRAFNSCLCELHRPHHLHTFHFTVTSSSLSLRSSSCFLMFCVRVLFMSTIRRIKCSSGPVKP